MKIFVATNVLNCKKWYSIKFFSNKTRLKIDVNQKLKFKKCRKNYTFSINIINQLICPSINNIAPQGRANLDKKKAWKFHSDFKFLEISQYAQIFATFTGSSDIWKFHSDLRFFELPQ